MGLFRKAAGAIPREGATPPLSFAPEPESAPGGHSGLLRRGLGLRDTPTANPASPTAVAEPAADRQPEEPGPPLTPTRTQVRHAEEVASEIAHAIGGLPDGVELPSRLFSIVSAGIGVRKGALLLYDALRLVYAPWASTGYDQTTLHRLRIPLGANESFNALANGAPLILSDAAALAKYQEYFSSREFSSLTRMFLAPFIASDRLVGVLLVTDCALATEPDADIQACLQGIVTAGSPRIDTARARKLASTGARAVQTPLSLEEQAKKFLGPAGTSAALFLALSTEEYARRILADHQHLDPFRLHEDLHYFLGAFVADMGAALSVRPGLFIVALRSLDVAELDVFQHQLALYLDGLFGAPENPQKESRPRVLKTRAWPSDGDDVRSLLDDLAS